MDANTFGNLKAKQEECHKILHDARSFLEKADKEKRNMTKEENESYLKAMAELDAARSMVSAIKKQNELEEERNTATSEPIKPELKNGKSVRANGTESYKAAFRNFLRHGNQAKTAELRDLQADVPSMGGYTVADEELSSTLLKKLDDLVFLRKEGSVFPVERAQSLGVPSLDADPEDGDWTAEIGTVSADTQMKTGKRELTPHPLTKLIKVSQKLLQVSSIDIASLVSERLAYKFAITEEKNFLTGDGVQKPLGLFTASADGINTDRDFTVGSTTAFTSDLLLGLKYSLKAPYRTNAKWLIHRDGVKQVALLKDTAGQYLFKLGREMDDTDMLLGKPVLESEYVPNTFTTGQYVCMFGDFKYYWIADMVTFGIQVITELFTLTNQNGYKGAAHLDGMPALSEAFARGKLA